MNYTFAKVTGKIYVNQMHPPPPSKQQLPCTEQKHEAIHDPNYTMRVSKENIHTTCSSKINKPTGVHGFSPGKPWPSMGIKKHHDN
jgi:hypothetical protein